jgi:hypothetical protein
VDDQNKTPKSLTEPPPLEAIEGFIRLGDFPRARGELEKAFSDQPKSAVYFFNLGTLDLKEGKLESAWIHFGLAKAASPDPAVDVALEQVELLLTRNGKRMTELDPTTDSLLRIGEKLPLTPLTLGSCGLLLLSVLWVAGSWMRNKARAAQWWLVGVTFLGTLMFLILTFWVNSFTPVWVVQDETARTGPGVSFLEVQKVTVGTKLRLVRKEKGWFRVRLNRNGSEGYLPATSLLLWEE